MSADSLTHIGVASSFSCGCLFSVLYAMTVPAAANNANKVELALRRLEPGHSN